MLDLIGESDRHLRQVESLFPEVRFVARGDEVVLKGSDEGVFVPAALFSQERILLSRNCSA